MSRLSEGDAGTHHHHHEHDADAAALASQGCHSDFLREMSPWASFGVDAVSMVLARPYGHSEAISGVAVHGTFGQPTESSGAGHER